MRFVHTFYSEPLLRNKFNNFNTAITFTLTDYACSAAFVKHFGHQIILVTDKIGYALLSFIPYDEIIILNTDENRSVHFAAQFKIEALKHITLDDILIDGDLFIRDHQSYDLLAKCSEDVVVSFFEPLKYTLCSEARNIYYTDMLNVMKNVTFEKPYHVPEMNDLEWPNTSMLKFNSQELKDAYIKQYEHHCKLLSNYDFNDKWPDIIIEQYFLRLLVQSADYSMKVFIEGFPSEESNQHALNIGFTHLGYGKVSAQNLVESWLYELDKDLYNVAMNEIKKYITHNEEQ